MERIQVVREAVGPNVQFRVDANQGWKNRSNTLRALERLKDYYIDWIEQSVAMDDVDIHREIRTQTATAVMIDEGIHSSNELLNIIHLKAAYDQCQIDEMRWHPSWHGGR